MQIVLNPTEASAAERRGQSLMIGGGLLLGTLGVFVEQSGQGALMAVWFRCVFGALSLLAFGAATGRLAELRLARSAWLPALASGALMVLNWGLFFGAIERTSIAVATVMFHIQPLLVIAFAAFCWRERISRAQLAAACVALLGLMLASGLGAQDLTPARANYMGGIVMCLGGAFSYAAVTLIAKAARGLSSYALAFWQCALGAVLLIGWPLSQGLPGDAQAWAWLAGLGVIHTGLAYVLLYTGMSLLPASRIAVLQFAYPLAAICVDRLVYGRALGFSQWAGVLLMFAALLVLRRPARESGILRR